MKNLILEIHTYKKRPDNMAHGTAILCLYIKTSPNFHDYYTRLSKKFGDIAWL